MSDDEGPPDDGAADALSERRLARLEALLPWAQSEIGLSIGPGWVQLVTDLHADLAALAPGYRVIQVKEKFGGLRFYAHHPDDLDEQDSAAFHARIHRAEAESWEVCEECGATGWLVSDRGLFRTLCERHGGV